MKANRKFLNSAAPGAASRGLFGRAGNDEGVSPVIAVILMVAITVVLAATVYVWVSGFGAQGSQPAKTLALTSAASYDTTTFAKQYTVASGTPGIKYTDLAFTLNGLSTTCESGSVIAAGTAAAPQFSVSKTGGSTWADCAATTTIVAAGDLIRIDSDATFSGHTLRVLDSQANSVMLTLVVG